MVKAKTYRVVLDVTVDVSLCDVEPDEVALAVSSAVGHHVNMGELFGRPYKGTKVRAIRATQIGNNV